MSVLTVARLVRELVDTENHREQVDEMAFRVRRHAGMRSPGWHMQVFPSLIDQLRLAVSWDLSDDDASTGTRGPITSSGPGNENALDVLLRVETGVAVWVAGEGRTDVKDRLRLCVGLATLLGPDDLNELVRDLWSWRAWARVETGWDRRTFTADVACPCCEHRALRIRGDGTAARCAHCTAAWSEDTRDDLPSVSELGASIQSQRHADTEGDAVA